MTSTSSPPANATIWIALVANTECLSPAPAHTTLKRQLTIGQSFQGCLVAVRRDNAAYLLTDRCEDKVGVSSASSFLPTPHEAGNATGVDSTRTNGRD